MSSTDKKHGSEGRKHQHGPWNLTGPWAQAWKVFAGIGALGLVGAIAGYFADPRRFAFSWMFAFITCLAIALGSIFFVLVQRLTSAGWSVTVRRTAEFFGYGILALIPLFIPILFSMGHLFPWLNAHDAAGGHGASPPGHASTLELVTPAYAQGHTGNPGPDHNDPQIHRGGNPHDGIRGQVPPAGQVGGMPGDPAGRLPGSHSKLPEDMPGGRRGPGMVGGGGAHGPGAAGAAYQHAWHESHALIHKEVMAKKSAFLNKNFFYLRAVLYFIIWTVLAVRLLRYSTAQDITKDPQLTLRAQAFAPPATFLFALSLTFAAFDWIMSLEPTWFSTIFGVYYFATGVVSSYAVIILTTMALRTAGPLEGAVTVEHYHDLGKLMFGFLVFWAYIGFSQYMLIWYAALPEETTWYHNRWDFNPWSKVTWAIMLGHFVVPFFWLISRNFKRNLGRLQLGAGILLVMHVVDIYWFVMPNYKLGQTGFAFSWIDIACLFAVGGIYGALVFFRMTKHSLVPVGDPRLERSLHFQNA